MSRGEPYGNGSWSHVLGMLRNDQCDFVVGGIFPDFEVHDDFGVTASYLQDSATWFQHLNFPFFHKTLILSLNF